MSSPLKSLQKENQSLRHEREAAEASMFEIQRKAMCASEGIATVAVKTQKRSSSSAPNLPGLGLTSSRRAGTDTDNRRVNSPRAFLERRSFQKCFSLLSPGSSWYCLYCMHLTGLSMTRCSVGFVDRSDLPGTRKEATVGSPTVLALNLNSRHVLRR